MSTEETQQEPAKPVIKVVELTPDGAKMPRFEHSIVFEYDSPLDGKLVGNFTYRKMTLGMLGQKAVTKARLNAGYIDGQIDPGTDFLNDCIAHLVVWFQGMTNAPDWAKDFTKLHDPETVYALFREGDSFEATFRKALGKRP